MKIIKQDRAKGFLGDLLDNMDKQTLSRAENRMGIALKIGDALKQNGISQREFADKMHKSYPEVCDWLSGNRNFTIDTLTDISCVLGIDLLDIESVSKNSIPRSINAKVRKDRKSVKYSVQTVMKLRNAIDTVPSLPFA